jgi:hypothetical protein
MNNFRNLLLKLGGLHDARLTAMNWNIDSSSIDLIINNIYANFDGFPEYPGRRDGSIKLEEVSYVESYVEKIEVEKAENLKIFDFLVMSDSEIEILIKFTPNGHLCIRCATATCSAGFYEI